MICAYRKRDDGGVDEQEEFKEPSYRTRLPSDMIDRSRFSIWSILKQCVDKEIYRFTIPIVWNEPLSLLQRMAESMRYSSQLDRAANSSQAAIDRIKFVTGFIVGCLSANGGRLSKPFNPLLGETFEFVSIENAYRICLEQVSHHPPISAFHAESIRPGAERPRWVHYGSNYPNVKLNILHGCIEATPEGISTIELPAYDETYSWHGIRIFAHNLVIGKLWFEYSGRSEIVCAKSKLKCVLDFKPYSWFSSNMINRFEGYICDLDNENKKHLYMYGKWDEFLFAARADAMKPSQLASRIEKLIASPNEKDDLSASGIELVWRSNDEKNSTRGSFDQQFNFSSYTFKLNELLPHLEKSTQIVLKNQQNDSTSYSVSLGPIPRTDSRLRPDMRMYENGQVDEASAEKHRLEEKQRDAARKVEVGEREKYTPLWFEKRTPPNLHDSIENASHHSSSISQYNQHWIFTNAYWNRDFSKCPDIF